MSLVRTNKFLFAKMFVNSVHENRFEMFANCPDNPSMNSVHTNVHEHVHEHVHERSYERSRTVHERVRVFILHFYLIAIIKSDISTLIFKL